MDADCKAAWILLLWEILLFHKVNITFFAFVNWLTKLLCIFDTYMELLKSRSKFRDSDISVSSRLSLPKLLLIFLACNLLHNVTLVNWLRTCNLCYCNPSHQGRENGGAHRSVESWFQVWFSTGVVSLFGRGVGLSVTQEFQAWAIQINSVWARQWQMLDENIAHTWSCLFGRLGAAKLRMTGWWNDRPVGSQPHLCDVAAWSPALQRTPARSPLDHDTPFVLQYALTVGFSWRVGFQRKWQNLTVVTWCRSWCHG